MVSRCSAHKKHIEQINRKAKQEWSIYISVLGRDPNPNASKSISGRTIRILGWIYDSQIRTNDFFSKKLVHWTEVRKIHISRYTGILVQDPKKNPVEPEKTKFRLWRFSKMYGLSGWNHNFFRVLGRTFGPNKNTDTHTYTKVFKQLSF